MDILWFLLIGLVAGWLAGLITKGSGFGLLGDLVIGVVGALLGGFLFSLIGISAGGVARQPVGRDGRRHCLALGNSPAQACLTSVVYQARSGRCLRRGGRGGRFSAGVQPEHNFAEAFDLFGGDLKAPGQLQ